MFDLFSNPDFLGLVYRTGWSTVSLIFFGGLFVILYAVIRQPEPFFQKFHIFHNLGFFCLLMIYSFSARVEKLKLIQQKPTDYQGWFFELVDDRYQVDQVSVIWAVIMIGAIFALSLILHPPRYKKGIGIETATMLRSFSKKRFYWMLAITSILRNFALFITVIALIKLTNGLTIIDVLNGDLTSDVIEGIETRVHVVMVVLGILAASFWALAFRNILKATQGVLEGYRPQQMQILIANYESYAAFKKPE